MNKGRSRIVAILAFFISVSCAAEIQVIDDLGRQLVFDTPVKRIVSLAPHNTENLFTAGAGDQIVGTVDHSDFPPAALDIPRIGNYKQFNLEAILALKPDLVIAWSSGNTEASVKQLIDLGLPVFYSEPGTFDLIISNIERFSRLSGQSEIAAPQLTSMRNTINTLEQRYAGQKPVGVFYQVWDQPLITLNGNHSVSRAIEICGGFNVFAEEPTIAPRINIEGIIAKNPQLILLAGHEKEQALTWKIKWEKWSAIDAVSHRQVKAIEADIVNRPTQRFIEGTRTICELIDAARQTSHSDP